MFHLVSAGLSALGMRHPVQLDDTVVFVCYYAASHESNDLLQPAQTPFGLDGVRKSSTATKKNTRQQQQPFTRTNAHPSPVARLETATTRGNNRVPHLDRAYLEEDDVSVLQLTLEESLVQRDFVNKSGGHLIKPDGRFGAEAQTVSTRVWFCGCVSDLAMHARVPPRKNDHIVRSR